MNRQQITGHTSLLVEPGQPKNTRRGESNALRRGQPKIHRRYAPELCCSVPRGMASKVVGRLKSHDWRRNNELIALRRVGLVPYKKRNDPNYAPKPMRIHARSEIRETLTVLSMAMAANCDYNPDSDYNFEIMLPFEQIAAATGTLHVYNNGRKAYDSALEGLSVMEQLGYVIVNRDRDTDTGQNKPLRIWLTDKFFTSRGILVEEIRQWLGQFKMWAIKNGLTESLRRKYEHHLLRIERIGISIKDKHSLRNRLKQIKRWVVSPDLTAEKQAKVSMLEGELETLRRQNDERLDEVLDCTASNLRSLARAKAKRQNPYYQAYIAWSTSAKVMPHQVNSLEQTLSQAHPGLRHSDPETFYRLLLERAGAL
ncbi:Replication protein [Rahnella sp. ChDrAdgB13]|uniref:Replication protein n=1 Tax=Rahnella sp. ChDrAdgB13 TaxID=1850581 RepID=UPI0027DC39C1|nr:Replication protein [Rahnella sp. ChDrAdgB13]